MKWVYCVAGAHVAIIVAGALWMLLRPPSGIRLALVSVILMELCASLYFLAASFDLWGAHIRLASALVIAAVIRVLVLPPQNPPPLERGDHHMKSSPLAACGLLGMLLVSGCLDNPPEPGGLAAASVTSASSSTSLNPPSPTSTTAPPASATPAPPRPAPASPGNATTASPAGPSSSSASNATPPPASEAGEPVYSPGWPSFSHAFIRPGGLLRVLVDEASVSCTVNFVFQSPNNRTLYVGTPAHCLAAPPSASSPASSCAPASLPLGYPVHLQGAIEPGTLAYSSWHTMQEVQETDPNACAGNDFALIQVNPRDRNSVHPAVFNHGGPTALANSSQIQALERLVSVGLSPYYAGNDVLTTHEGYVSEAINGGWETVAYMAPPAYRDDAGSPVLDEAGQAVGILTDWLPQSTPGTTVFTNLDKALAYAQDHAGIEVRLATWEVFEPGRLPSANADCQLGPCLA